jgi:hypothetical protein
MLARCPFYAGTGGNRTHPRAVSSPYKIGLIAIIFGWYFKAVFNASKIQIFHFCLLIEKMTNQAQFC